jgi:hypothetical protein
MKPMKLTLLTMVMVCFGLGASAQNTIVKPAKQVPTKSIVTDAPVQKTSAAPLSSTKVLPAAPLRKATLAEPKKMNAVTPKNN